MFVKFSNLHYEYTFWMWNTNSIQLLEPNRNNRKPTSKIKTEPNRTEQKKNLNRGSPSVNCCFITEINNDEGTYDPLVTKLCLNWFTWESLCSNFRYLVPFPITTAQRDQPIKFSMNVYLSYCFSLKARLHGGIFVAIFLILTHAIEWSSHKSIDLYSFAQMVYYIRIS